VNKSVLLETRDGIATVTLNRPEGANALDMAMGRDLLEAALAVEADPMVRAVVVTGAGKHFCFGGDLRGMAEKGVAVGGYLNELTTNIHAAISCFTRLRAPVIAAVNGTAAGGGVGLVCMTDLAIAGRGSSFRSLTPVSASRPTAAPRSCCRASSAGAARSNCCSPTAR
jgi:2-(1,2-epoxy-1,2-dihydrophenyl)acetyl-CoA isomerase